MLLYNITLLFSIFYGLLSYVFIQVFLFNYRFYNREFINLDIKKNTTKDRVSYIHTNRYVLIAALLCELYLVEQSKVNFYQVEILKN